MRGSKIISLFLVITLCLALAGPAWAAEGPGGTGGEEIISPDDPGPGGEDVTPSTEPGPGGEEDIPTEPVITPDPGEKLDSGTCGADLVWTFSDDGVLTISGTGRMDSNPWNNRRTEIRSVVIGEGVTSIVSNAFYAHTALTSVRLPASIEAVESYAFYGCTGLADVEYAGTAEQWAAVRLEGGGYGNELLLPAILAKIGSVGGTVGSGTTWTLTSDGLLTISGSGMFYGNPPWAAYNECVRTVIIEDGVKRIASSMFESCHNMTSIRFPADLSSIGDYAFYGCTSLASMEYDAPIEQWLDVSINDDGDGNLDLYPAVVARFGSVGGSCGSQTAWTLTSDGVLTVSGTGTIASAPWGNYRKCIRTVVIEDGVTTIPARAFSSDSEVPGSVGYPIEGVRLPASLKSIGDYAFDGCVSLTSVRYDGSEEQWSALKIGVGNELLISPGVPGADGEASVWAAAQLLSQSDKALEAARMLQSVVGISG